MMAASVPTQMNAFCSFSNISIISFLSLLFTSLVASPVFRHSPSSFLLLSLNYVGTASQGKREQNRKQNKTKPADSRPPHNSPTSDNLSLTTPVLYFSQPVKRKDTFLIPGPPLAYAIIPCMTSETLAQWHPLFCVFKLWSGMFFLDHEHSTSLLVSK